jgi:hypothetical protein
MKIKSLNGGYLMSVPKSAIPKKNGEIHTFPIGPEHPNY